MLTPSLLTALAILGYLATSGYTLGENHEYPCAFNSLCRCAINSTAATIFHKLVFCNYVPFARIPEIPKENVTKLSIVGSGLEILDDNSLRDLELSSLNLAKNDLVIMTDEALIFSAKLLSALDLSYNRLQLVPQKALASLSSLLVLSLESNEISSLLVDWNYMKHTLTTLFLGGNDLNVLTSAIDYTLSNFQRLILLNINNNYITNLEQNSLPFTLKTLHASHNLIEEFPTHLVNNLDNLTKLYLGDNFIQQIPSFKFKDRKHIDTLDLSNNLITNLNDILGRSLTIKEINLAYNQIASVNSFAFSGILCTKLDLSHNRLNSLPEKAFYGLKTTLEELDLSYNNITKIPRSVAGLRKLKTLSLAHNHIYSLPDSTFKNSSHYLHVLLLSGNSLHSFPKYALRNIKRLIKLEISYNSITELRSSDFTRWGDQLELLYMKSNKIDSLEYNAFKNLPKLRKLGLAFNRIETIDSKAFSNLAVPLKYLDLSFAIKTNEIPEESIKSLKNLEQLILANNNFTTLPRTALYNFGRLQQINLEFNHILEIPEAFFNSIVLKHLADIRLSFNKLYMVDTNTFLDLASLQFIGLNDNEITTVNSGAFKNLPAKLAIILANNNIHMVHPKAFLNLPYLNKLDLHNNDLQTLDWNMLHNVTNTLQPLTMNLSRNRIETIAPPAMQTQIYVKVLDLRHNKLKTINSDGFKFLNDSLRTLMLGFNEITQLPERAFWTMKFVEILSIEHNMLKELKETTFHGMDRLQILDLSHNHISRINVRQFSNLWNLRILDLSYNELSTIPGESFVNTKLERLILKHNRISVIPPQAFYEIGKSLHHLDLSNNMIEHLEKDVFSYVNSLTNLNLCSNYLSQLHDQVFMYLDNLLNLQLCNNKLARNFEAIDKTKRLHYLNLANTGIKEMPNLQLSQLIHLNISGNNISQLQQGFLLGLPNLRQLDLSRNNLTGWSIVGWNHAQNLKELDLSNNPVKILTKDTFEGLENLKTLNLQNLKYLERFDSDSLTKCKLLKWLKIQTWPNIEKYRFRLPSVVFNLKHLKKLTVEVTESKLHDQLMQAFPSKLKYLEITGINLSEVHPEALKGLDGNKELTLKFTGTNITNFPPLFFWKFANRLTVDLRGNSLDQAGPEMFYKSMNSVRKHGTKIYSGGIHVQDNPILCNCDSHWLGYWMKRYLFETLRIHQKEAEYSRAIIENMKQATCINPMNGRHTPILTFEMDGCDVSNSIQAGLNLTLFIISLLWIVFLRR
uniref:Putative gpcr class b orphan receptor 1 n=1 Tax=Panstrongylus lignarius TaxID=156445 RepID=A0A224XD61_9HEMI